MAVRDFAIDLIDELLKDKELTLADKDIRFYDRGTTAETDEDLDDHIRWKTRGISTRNPTLFAAAS